MSAPRDALEQLLGRLVDDTSAPGPESKKPEAEVEVRLVWAPWCGHSTKAKELFDELKARVVGSKTVRVTFVDEAFGSVYSQPSLNVDRVPAIIVSTKRKLPKRGDTVEEMLGHIEEVSGLRLSSPDVESENAARVSDRAASRNMLVRGPEK